MQHLPNRLRALRRQHELSLDQLAQRTGLTKSYLSKVERGLSEPSISTVLKLAQAYSVGVAQLVGADTDEQDQSVSVVRHNQREKLVRGDQKAGYIYEAIAGARHTKAMDPFIIYPPREADARPVSQPHAGEEFMFVLTGTVHVSIGDQAFDLVVGDSIYFDSELPHRISTTSEENAKVLVVASRAR